MKASLWGLVVVVGLGLMVGWYLRQPPEEQVDQVEEEKPAILTSIEMKDYLGSVVKVRLFAKQAKVFEKSETTDLSEVYGIIASKKPEGLPTKIWANQGKLSGKTKLMTLTGDVRVEFPEGRVLETEVLVYDQQKELLQGDQPVRMFGRGDSVDAAGLLYFLKTEVLTLTLPSIEVTL